MTTHTGPDGETHIDDDDARAGATPGVMRYVLGISLLLAIIAMTIAWVTGALTQGAAESAATVTGTVEATDTADDSSMDGVVADTEEAAEEPVVMDEVSMEEAPAN